MSRSDGYCYNGMGVLGVENELKQRKSRDNHARRATDKLRAWFVTHSRHPYPTEREKIEVMRQTGLCIEKISTWFINARRREVPAALRRACVRANLLHVPHSAGDTTPAGFASG